MPEGGDENMYLRATAMYTDGHGPDKSEMAESAQHGDCEYRPRVRGGDG